MKKTCVVTAAVLLASPASSADNVLLKFEPVATTDSTSSGQPIALPARAKVIVSHFAIAPQSTLPDHKHLHARYDYIESGKLRETNLDTGKIDEFSAGDFIVEPVGQWHRVENVGAGPVKLLVIDQLDSSDSNAGNVVLRDAPH